jgi:hypothetical protein
VVSKDSGSGGRVDMSMGVGVIGMGEDVDDGDDLGNGGMQRSKCSDAVVRWL